MNTNRFEHISDSELLEKFNADHNNEWLGILLQRYTLLLFGTCMKYLKNEEEAKDAVQQIFLKAITELQKYKVSYFKSWLYMIARNYCLMKLRDKNIFIPVEERIPEEDTSEEKMELANTAKTVSLLEASIPELNEEQKTCVTLFYLKKKSYIEIASVTGFSLLQVKSHIQNGKRNLKSLIEKKMKNK